MNMYALHMFMSHTTVQLLPGSRRAKYSIPSLAKIVTFAPDWFALVLLS